MATDLTAIEVVAVLVAEVVPDNVVASYPAVKATSVEVTKVVPVYAVTVDLTPHPWALWR